MPLIVIVSDDGHGRDISIMIKKNINITSKIIDHSQHSSWV